MRNILTKLATVIALIISAYSAVLAQVSQPHVCGTHYYYQDLYSKHPGLKEQDEAFDAALASYLSQVDISTLQKTRAGEKIIPVVFHVLHDYGAENISDAQIYDQMRILNEDFNKRNADTAAIVPVFKPIIGDAKIKFMLARKDPNGNCTNGIDRIHTYKTRGANDESKLNAWSRNYYFNVWVINTMSRPNVAGYAYKPQTLNGGFINMYDGIIVLHDYIGSIGTGSPGPGSRTLTHEFGHSLGLDHTWGPTNEPGEACGDDGVSDTPPTEGHSSCPTSALIGDSVCTTGSQSVPGPLENLQNYMEYSFCPNGHMFTIGQCDKMNEISFVLNNASRALLTTELAHTVTGVFDTTNVCPPKTDFAIRRYFTCLGTPNVNLNNATTNAPAGTTLSWSMPNSPQNGATTPTVTGASFTTPGWQPISLTATASTGSTTLSKNNKLYVSDPAATVPANYAENFEHATNVDKWPIFNFYDNYFKWSIANNGYDGGKCIKMNTFDDRPGAAGFTGTPSGDGDEFISPAYDLSSTAGLDAYLTFASSGATTTSNFSEASDSFTVFYSTNCGASWVRLGFATVSQNNLFNKLQVLSNYAPTSNNDWIWRSYTLPEAAKTNATYFRFRFKSSNYSNNFYIDNIAAGTWVASLGNLYKGGLALSVFPNPNTGDFTLRLSEAVSANIDITDVTGKVVHSVSANELAASGQASVRANLPNGVYFATAYLKGTKLVTQKFVVSK